MTTCQPTVLELHFVNGQKQTFCHNTSDVASRICLDFSNDLFRNTHFIVEGSQDVTVVTGQFLLGITVIVTPLPESCLAQEQKAQAVAVQMSKASYESKRLACQGLDELSIPILTDVLLASSEHVYFEFLELDRGGPGDRYRIHDLFSEASLSTRNIEGGFSLWNTAHFVSWSHFPKLELEPSVVVSQLKVPNNAVELRILR